MFDTRLRLLALPIVVLCASLAACGGGTDSAAVEAQAAEVGDGTDAATALAIHASRLIVSITAPVSGTTTAQSSVMFYGPVVASAGISSVTWRTETGASGTATLGTGSNVGFWGVPSVALHSGSNTLTVQARDRSGNTSTASVTVTRLAGNTPPTPTPTPTPTPPPPIVPPAAPPVVPPVTNPGAPTPPIATSPGPLAPATGATYYVDASAANDNGSGSIGQPKKYIGSAVALMSASGGDTVIVKPGTYGNSRDAIGAGKPGSAGAWNVVKAEVDGSVTITAALAIPLGDHYLRFEGLKWDSATSKAVTGRYVKFMRCAFKGGPPTDNTVGLAIGTNDATPGAQYILVEDSYVYGPGGRYNILVYNADKIVLRRVVARHENGWTDTAGDPQATVSLYNSTDVLTQNLLLVDSGASGYFEGALYHPSNSRASSNIRNIGAVILNTAGAAVGWDDHNASSGNLLEDSVIWKATSAININGASHAGLLNRLTIGQISAGGVADWGSGGRFSIQNSLLWKVSGNTFRSVPHAGNDCFAPVCSGEASVDPLLSGLRWLPQILQNSPLATLGLNGSRVGATVLKRLGVSGTLYGETGFDQTTTTDLWPWPNEAAIQKSMCTDMSVTTGFCAKSSLTQYVWEQLGVAMPSTFGGQ